MKVSPLLLALMLLNLGVTAFLVIASELGLWGIQLPPYVPFHWNLAGDVDAWAHVSSLLFVAALPPVLYGLMFLLPRLDTTSTSHDRRRGVFSLLVAVFTLFFISMQWSVLATAYGLPLNLVSLLKMGLGGLFLLVGVTIPRIPPGFFLGIRTPWTLGSEAVWRRTHKMGGWVFFFLGTWTFMLVYTPGILDSILLFSGLLGAVGYLFYFSYREFRKLNVPTK